MYFKIISNLRIKFTTDSLNLSCVKSLLSSIIALVVVTSIVSQHFSCFFPVPNLVQTGFLFFPVIHMNLAFAVTVLSIHNSIILVCKNKLQGVHFVALRISGLLPVLKTESVPYAILAITTSKNVIYEPWT